MGNLAEPSLAIAVSGGIDSSVAAFLLKQSYRNIFGIHFRTGYESGRKISREDLENCLNMDVICVDLNQEFEQNVVSYFVDTYLAGQTPNPCLVCNQYIKFGTLLEKAEQLGAQYLATGHYANVVNSLAFPRENIVYPWLEQAADQKKDQSYFLARLNNNQLNRVIFPLGNMSKDQVKHLAMEKELVPLYPSESQDICFIHNQKVTEFIISRTGIVPRRGDIVNTHGRTVGQHNGILGFTLGQRRGIDCPAKEAYYVKQIDILSNTLYVCHKNDMAQNETKMEQLIWNRAFEYSNGMSVDTKIRYAHHPASSQIFTEPGSTNGKIIFTHPQYAITPGQAAVFYKEKKILGSAIIQ